VIKWGISSNSHNAALSIFDDDSLIFASSSERFSKIKNDSHINEDLIDHAFSFGNPDEIYWYENPKLKTLRQLFSGIQVIIVVTHLLDTIRVLLITPS